MKYWKRVKGFTLFEMLIVAIILWFGVLVAGNATKYLYDLFMDTTYLNGYQHAVVSISNFQNWSNQYLKGCTKIDDHNVSCYNIGDKKYYLLEVDKDNTNIFMNINDWNNKLNIFSVKRKKKHREEEFKWENLSDVYALNYFVLELPTEQKIYFDLKW